MTESSSAISKKIGELVRLELDELVRTRDEIRRKIHLADSDGRSTWARLEKQFDELEARFGHEGGHIVDPTRQIAAEVRTAFRDFKHKLPERMLDRPDLPA